MIHVTPSQAHFTPIPPLVCQACRATLATHRVYDGHNEPEGVYCLRHARDLVDWLNAGTTTREAEPSPSLPLVE